MIDRHNGMMLDFHPRLPLKLFHCIANLYLQLQLLCMEIFFLFLSPLCKNVWNAYPSSFLPLHTHRVVLVPRVHAAIQDHKVWRDREEDQEVTDNKVAGDHE